MKLTRRDVSVLLYIVAILAVFLTYQFYYSSTVESAEEVLTECNSLQAQVNELKAKVDNQPIYEAEIEDMKEGIAEVLDLYPSTISEEDIILYVQELNEELNMGIDSVSFSSATPIYSVVGSGHAEEYSFLAESISVNINYTTDYDGLKRIVNYINDDPDHRVISSISIGVSTVEVEDESGNLDEDAIEQIAQTGSTTSISGSLSLTLYLIDGKPADLEDTENRYELPEVEHGVDEAFSAAD